MSERASDWLWLASRGRKLNKLGPKAITQTNSQRICLNNSSIHSLALLYSIVRSFIHSFCFSHSQNASNKLAHLQPGSTRVQLDARE